MKNLNEEIERLTQQIENVSVAINYVNKNDSDLTIEDEEWLTKNTKYRKLIIEDLATLKTIKEQKDKLNLMYDIIK